MMRPRYADVAATLALVLGLGGTSYAVAQVTSGDIVDDTIRSRDVRDGTLKGADVANGTLGLADLSDGAEAALQGQQGPAGTDGTALGYALVKGTNPGDDLVEEAGGLSRGLTDANVTRVATGIYCIHGLTFEVHNVQATFYAGTPATLGLSTRVGSDVVCGDLPDVAATVRVKLPPPSTEFQDEWFSVLLN